MDVERRRIPALSRDVSSAGFALPTSPGVARNGWRAGTLSRAIETGFNLFDCGGSPEAETIVGRSIPDASSVVCLVDLEGSRSEATGGHRGHLEKELAERQRRCGDRVHLVPLVPVRRALERGNDPMVPTLRSATAGGRVLGWGVRVSRRDTDPRDLRAAVDAGAAVLVGPYSLLERDAAEHAIRLLEGTGSRWIATDPFAGGALDGTWLAGNPVGRDPTRGPMRLDDLRASAGPVLALAYLTQGHRRTLPEAALRFPLLSTGVASVVASLDTPNVLPLAISAERSPPFDDEEKSRLLAGR